MDRRVYVTTLPFAHDLCRAINVGINNPTPASQEPGTEATDVSPTKYNNYSDGAARKRLGKRLLKVLQPYLESALKAEADICGKPYDALQKELEGLLEASLEVRQLPLTSITVSEDNSAGQDQDVDMIDAPAEGQIIVADHSEGEEDAEGEPDDVMDGTHVGEDNIEVGSYDEHGEATPRPNGAFSSANSHAGDIIPPPKETTPYLTNGFIKPSSTSPPSLPGGTYNTHTNHQPPNHNNLNPHSGPLTPPQSHTSNSGAPSFATTAPAPHHNPLVPITTTAILPTITTTTTSSSLSSSSSSAAAAAAAAAPTNNHSHSHTTVGTNPLTDGGVPWYLAGFAPRGTTAAHAQWTATAREALRSLSEELTDMDEEALRDLEFDVDEENTITIANAAGAAAAASVDGDGVVDGADGEDMEEDEDGVEDGDEDGEGGEDGEGDEDGDEVEGEETKGGSGNGNETKNGTGTGKAPALMVSGRKVDVLGSVGGGGGVGVGAGGAGGSPRKRTRSEVAAATTVAGRFSLRKGVRSSARRK